MSLCDLIGAHWKKLGGVPPDALEAPRHQAHRAIQIVASLGQCLLKQTPDDSRVSVQWLSRIQALVGEDTPGGLRAGLRLHDLSLMLLNKDGTEHDSQSLAGTTTGDALKWLQQSWSKATSGDVPKLSLPDWEMPGHAAKSSEKFEVDSKPLAELARWYANADVVLQFVSAREKDATRVRCWPHHFDMDTVLQTGKHRSIGVGMSPGDDSYRQPYFYVTLNPSPEGSLPALKGGGVWHRNGWTGAVLTASKLVAAREPEAQVAALTEFVEHAIGASRQCQPE